MTDTAEQVCPFGDDCDLTVAYMSGFGRGKYLAARQTQEAVARAERAETELADLIHDLERLKESETDALNQVQEAVAAALMEAVNAVVNNFDDLSADYTMNGKVAWSYKACVANIRALIPAPALAALEARDARVREAEREACAKVAEVWIARDMHEAMTPGAREQNEIARQIAAAIREGGK